MDQSLLSPRAKSVPARFWGRSPSDVVAERPRLAEFSTPLITYDASAGAHNVATLFGWAKERGLELAPHGKTTMAPQLWAELLAAGATALTLATPWQVQVARSAGIGSIILANELVDPVSIAWVTSTLDAHPDFTFACWLDSLDGLAALAASPGERPIDVLIELGSHGGRSGMRGIDKALALAWAAAREPRVRLVGIAGYEGTYGDDRGEAAMASVRGYLASLVDLFQQVDGFELFAVPEPIITAGGSAWFDLVDEAFVPLAGRARRILRSGAFQAHDDVHYAALSPLGETDADPTTRLRSAITGWARVVSRPEPGLALLDAGKRDVPYDIDLPVPQLGDGSPMPGARISAVNDQHAYLELPHESPLRVGDVVRLGLSHPCTAFDKWRLMPVIDDARAADPRVIDFIETVF